MESNNAVRAGAAHARSTRLGESGPHDDLGAVLPRLGFKPNTPQIEAGTRIDPPPSLACAKGTRPAATAATAPPDEPPAEYDRSQGLCVTPSSSVSVLPSKPSSDVAVLPTVTSPAASAS